LYRILSSQMTKKFGDNCDINIVPQTSFKPLFPHAQVQLKIYFFVPFVRSCMLHNYGVISSQLWWMRCMQGLRVAYNLGCRALYNLPFRASVSSYQVQCNIPHLRHYEEKTSTCFSKDAENLLKWGWVLWCSQIVCIRPYSLNTTTAFCFVTECSDIAVLRLRLCHVTMHSYFTCLE